MNPQTLQQVQIAFGALCELCGRLLESFPSLTLADVKEKLANESDFTFHILWEAAKATAANPGDNPFGLIVVGRTCLTGIRARWLYDFVETTIFLEKIGVNPDDREFKLKLCTMRDPEGGKHTGVLLKAGSVPVTIQHIEVELYTDDHVVYNEVLLDRGESLHPKHSKNVEDPL